MDRMYLLVSILLLICTSCHGLLFSEPSCTVANASYQICTNRVNRTTAASKCSLGGGILLQTRSVLEYAFLMAFLALEGYIFNSFWVGLVWSDSVSGYVWENTTSIVTINGGTGLCASFETPTFSFEANRCTDFKGYICQKVEPQVLIQSSSNTSTIYTTSDRSTVLYSSFPPSSPIKETASISTVLYSSFPPSSPIKQTSTISAVLYSSFPLSSPIKEAASISTVLYSSFPPSSPIKETSTISAVLYSSFPPSSPIKQTSTISAVLYSSFPLSSPIKETASISTVLYSSFPPSSPIKETSTISAVLYSSFPPSSPIKETATISTVLYSSFLPSSPIKETATISTGIYSSSTLSSIQETDTELFSSLAPPLDTASYSTATSILSSNVEASSPTAPVSTFTNTSAISPHHPSEQSYTYLCSCQCSNYTRAKDGLTHSQSEELVHSIQFNLLLNKKNLSAVIRKLSSVPDHRPSAEVLGGVLVLTAVACGVVAMDCSRYFSWLSRRKSLAVKVQPATHR